MNKKGIETCCGIVCILGVLLVIGTAGASDLNKISLRQAIVRSSLGLVMFAGAGQRGGFML